MKFVKKFSNVNLTNLNEVGGKNASLGELIQNLKSKGIDVPDGFAITIDAYSYFLNYNNLESKIIEIVKDIDVSDIQILQETGLKIRKLILNSVFPEDLELSINTAYKELINNDIIEVAVRSSSSAEDLPDASFAGQQDTYLNIRGIDNLLFYVKSCYASLYNDRAISYRELHKYSQIDVKISVGIQKMVRADLATSGVAFSLDTESGFNDIILINSAWGLGELVVSGGVKPDEYILYKPAIKKNKISILDKKLGDKKSKMIYANSGNKINEVPTSSEEYNTFSLPDEYINLLGKWVLAIEEHYSSKTNKACPVDVEWAIDGKENKLYILQARPETIHSKKVDNANLIHYKINKDSNTTCMLTGIAIGDKISSGKVKILKSIDEYNIFNDGDILVTEITTPDWEPILKKAGGIITNKGGRTCHAAIVARELGVNAIVGTLNATEILIANEEVTLSCAEGETGFIYEKVVPYQIVDIDLESIPKPKTKIMLNIGAPQLALKYSFLPNRGVGLARLEFIINNYIKIHPLALLKHKELHDSKLTDKILSLTRNYENEESYFIKELSFGIGKIAAAFAPNDVIVRLSDFKSNEYSDLLGGKYFEPKEENPMIGWRGASRYYSDKYKEAFGLECKSIKYLREKMGFENIIVMIPFCRSVKELILVLSIMKDYGLERGVNGLKIYIMCEIPSNVINASEFAKYIDGVSIGGNDLLQLTLGLDRDSELVSHLSDNNDIAYRRMISMAINNYKKEGVKVGFCGQQPSDSEEFAQYLVKEGIDSISVTPDSVIKTIKSVHNIEVNSK